MTEKNNINGVDVAGCEFCKPNPLYKIEYACHCRGYIQDDGLHVHLSCEHNPNCYYKQLKRLEQENKELQAYKDINEDFKQAWYELNEKYKQLRSALEDIKEIAERYKDMEGCRIPLRAIKMIVDEVLTP